MTTALFDLTAAAATFERNEKFKRLAHLIRQTIGAASADEDLAYAGEALAIAVKTSSPDEGHEGARITGALLFQALILYMRGTTVSSKNRRSSPVTEKWTIELKEKHKNISDLRHDALAHFGPATRHPGGFWAKETLVLNVGKDGSQIVPLCLRTNYRGAVAAELGELIPAARASLKQIIEQRSRDLILEISRIESDPALLDVLRANPFDAYSFYVSEEAARDALRAASGGPSSDARSTWRPAGTVR